jgi:hypothetical protein
VAPRWWAKALLFHLQHRDLRAFDPYAAAPETAEKAEAIDHCRSEIERFVADLLCNADATKPLMRRREIRNLADSEIASINARVNDTALGIALRSAGVQMKKIKINGKTETVHALLNYEYWKKAPHKAWCEQISKQDDSKRKNLSLHAVGR